MRKQTRKRWMACLLMLIMAVSLLPGTAANLLPGTGLTALAAEDDENPSGGVVHSTENDADDTHPQGRMRVPAAPTAAVYQDVHVNGVTLGDGKYLASNSATTASSSSTEPETYVAWYKNGVLTLKNYNGKQIQVYGIPKSDLTVKLKNSNIITSSYRGGIIQNGNGGSITVTADSSSGKLTINATYSYSVAGIANGGAASEIPGDVTIKGYADVTIKAKTTGGSSNQGYGIYAKNAFVLDNASVNITCETPDRISGSLCHGIYAKETASINTAGKIKIDVTNAGKEDAYSYGIYVAGRSLTLTKAAEMVVEWRKGAAAVATGAPYYPTTASFNTSSYAINEDTTNCCASYRKGKPYQVTAGNGKLTGPGVKYKKYRGQFLKGDKVSITPNVKTGRSGEVIPFRKWTSDDVTIVNPTSPSNSFTVPAKNVTVIAEHNPFDGKPTFTPTSDLNNQGVLTFQTVVKPYDQNEGFALVKVGEEDSYIYINPVTSSTSKPYVYTYEASSGHSASYVAPGEYYVAEKLDNWWYLSEQFTVNYVKPRPDISTDWWFDPMVFPSAEEGYNFAQGRQLTITNKGAADTGALSITVEGTNPEAFTVNPGSFTDIAAGGGKAVSTVRPAKGLTAGEYYATLKIKGDNVTTLSYNMKFIVRPKMTAIPRPTANTGLVYDGTEKIGVSEGAGYTLTGTYKATDVGAADYTATATLNSGYKWDDDGTEDVTITWNIGKRTPQPTDIVVTPPTNLVYDGSRKDVAAQLDSKYTGAGTVTISKYQNPDTGEVVQPINVGTYTVFVDVAGGSNFHSAASLNRPGVWNFTIAQADQNAPADLTAAAPAVSGGKGKINGTTAKMEYHTNQAAGSGWTACTKGSTMVAPGTYYVRYARDDNHHASPAVKVTVPEYSTGVSVSGAVKSYNPKNAVTLQLIKQGQSGAAYETTIAAGTSSDGNPLAQSFRFESVAAGTYDLVVRKDAYLVYTVKNIEVGASAVDLTKHANAGIRTITLIAGNMNGDSNVNADDLNVVWNAANFNRPTKDAANKLTDINGDGNVNADDLNIIWNALNFNKSVSSCVVNF